MRSLFSCVQGENDSNSGGVKKEELEEKPEPMEVEEKKPEMKTEPKEEEDNGSNGTTSSSPSQSRRKSESEANRSWRIPLYLIKPTVVIKISGSADIQNPVFVRSERWVHPSFR